MADLIFREMCGPDEMCGDYTDCHTEEDAINGFTEWVEESAEDKARYDEDYEAMRKALADGSHGYYTVDGTKYIFTNNGTLITEVTLMCSDDEGATWREIRTAWC